METVALKKIPERCQRWSLFIIKRAQQMSPKQGENHERSQSKLDTNLSFYLLFKTSTGKKSESSEENSIRKVPEKCLVMSYRVTKDG